jgi:enamine deaminase RidA (YjgF/YER057c/UK114 family)
MTARVLQPEGWPRPRGYANGISARGRLIFVAGQIGWNERGALAGSDLVSQVKRALQNILTILATDGAAPTHIVRLTWFIVDREDYLKHAKGLGEVYREVMGAHYPAMSVVQVAALIESGALVEIEATAVVPEL